MSEPFLVRCIAPARESATFLPLVGRSQCVACFLPRHIRPGLVRHAGPSGHSVRLAHSKVAIEYATAVFGNFG